MYYYKEMSNDELVGLQAFEYQVSDENFEEITKQEYDTIIAEIKAEAQANMPIEEIPTYEELEEENARLLYELLTGEEM